MTSRVRRPGLFRQHVCLAGLACLAGCRTDVPPAEYAAAWTVTPSPGDDRVLLVSEAMAAAAKGEPFESSFAVAVPGPESLALELSSVGCNCYGVRHAGRPLRIGDRLSVPSGGRCDVTIASASMTSIGIRQFRADFTARGPDGAQSNLTLASTLRTVADLALQPDVVSVDLPRGAAAAEPINLAIEQHVRTADPSGVRVEWGTLPDLATCTRPVRDGTPLQIAPGLWRLRWRSALCVMSAFDETQTPDAPVQLCLQSFNDGRQLARTTCTLVPRRRYGIRAPRLIHFGRIGPDSRLTRRIQLQALDGKAFTVTEATSRDGETAISVPSYKPAVVHWLEVVVTSPGTEIDDLLTIRLDHPSAGELRIPVRGFGTGVGR